MIHIESILSNNLIQGDIVSLPQFTRGALTYTIKIPHFEGPFDLLLFFIERDELDIYDIPIAQIANDFLEYMRTMETLNIDMASEFILVAATLMRIKAKMLIPRKELDEEGNEIDPRDELVNRLIEYRRYKSVMDDLRQMEIKKHETFPRGYAKVELKSIAEIALVDAELESVTLYKLMNAFKRVMARFEDEKAKAIHRIVRYNFTIVDQQVQIMGMLEKKKRVGFEDIFSTCENRIHAIITFLGMLELLNLQKISLLSGSDINHFWLVEQVAEDEEE
jgi:segregation and condensation protein A